MCSRHVPVQEQSSRDQGGGLDAYPRTQVTRTPPPRLVVMPIRAVTEEPVAGKSSSDTHRLQGVAARPSLH